MSGRTSLAVAALTALVVTSAVGPRPAMADGGVPAPSLYVGVFGGAHLVLDDWDLSETSDGGATPDTSPSFGLRIGVQLAPWLAAEVGAAFLPFSADAGASGVAANWRADVLLSPVAAAWSPHALLGGGLYQALSSDLGDDADWEVHYGLGLRGILTDWLALRLEARHILTDSSGDGLASNVEVSLGADIVAWSGASARGPRDRDGDTIPDDEDRCPDLAGRATAQGCPDADGDGLIDADDRCPDLPGPRMNAGCPDSDGDGVTDDIDRCVDAAGPRTSDGCPPPPADADGDGVSDAKDACPGAAGPPHLGGCPDRDGDGVLDPDDQCPDQIGLSETAGCLPENLAARLSGVIPGVLFQRASAVLDRRSYRVLDEVAAVLAQYPALYVEIGGHVAADEAEQGVQLSQDRAEAVRAYLIEKGVDASRVRARGFGASHPRAAGTSAASRAQNRRIEITLVPAPTN